jgi:hypothetical protein
MTTKRYMLAAAIAMLGLSAALVYAQSHSQKAASVEDADGNLQVPPNYRDTYEFLGAWSAADDKAPGAKQLHIVYASPGTRAAYKRTGKFPDGTVLVKEQFSADTAKMTPGTVSRENKLIGWFVLVKDDTKRHPQNALWGDGWGWSHFDATSPTRTTATDYTIDCLGCHVPAQSTGYVYMQGYPTLQH